jgi:hypothetical protein
MVGHATGFNQAVETVKGEGLEGEKIQGIDRFLKGVNALMKIVNTVMKVGGLVQLGSLLRPVKIVSPVYRIAGLDIVIAETTAGRQAFYRSDGISSRMKGTWLPFDELVPQPGGFWMNKKAYTQGPGLEKPPLHRFGTEEFLRISKKLGKMSIPEGHDVPASKVESDWMQLNRILDFFGAKITPETRLIRPVPEQ